MSVAALLEELAAYGNVFTRVVLRCLVHRFILYFLLEQFPRLEGERCTLYAWWMADGAAVACNWYGRMLRIPGGIPGVHGSY